MGSPKSLISSSVPADSVKKNITSVGSSVLKHSKGKVKSFKVRIGPVEGYLLAAGKRCIFEFSDEAKTAKFLEFLQRRLPSKLIGVGRGKQCHKNEKKQPASKTNGNSIDPKGTSGPIEREAPSPSTGLFIRSEAIASEQKREALPDNPNDPVLLPSQRKLREAIQGQSSIFLHNHQETQSGLFLRSRPEPKAEKKPDLSLYRLGQKSEPMPGLFLNGQEVEVVPIVKLEDKNSEEVEKLQDRPDKALHFECIVEDQQFEEPEVKRLALEFSKKLEIMSESETESESEAEPDDEEVGKFVDFLLKEPRFREVMEDYKPGLQPNSKSGPGL